MQNQFDRGAVRPTSFAQTEIAQYMSRVYGWMTLGIAMSSLVAWWTANNTDFTLMLLQNRNSFLGIVLVQFALVMVLSFAINRINSFVAAVLYFLYAALTGVTLSILFFAYTQQSLFSVFFVTALAFAGLSSFGYITKRDLGPIGSFCMMALFGLVAYGLLSMFFPSIMGETGSMIYSVGGVLIFSGLTAYDTQMIKAQYVSGSAATDMARKGAIFGALRLYLDFINLFMSLLRLTGRRR